MRLEKQDMDKIVAVVAARYFTQQNWKWLDLNSNESVIFEAMDDISDQYDKYPYMSRDWYVDNSANKNIHMCDKWDDLKALAEFLRDYGEHFDFLVNNGKKSFCIASLDGNVSPEQKTAISAARRSRYNVFIFRVDVPGEIDFELMQIGGGF
ncbi:hypothetical protein V7O66_02005 [Methanolobus sp. ZRKC3]|uniref:hypothetical protein n=1 Tax=Methanolobus sp. ZRKC3 TaxID=3125786 RepID=UPI003253119C